MIKRTLYFGNPAYIRCHNQQLEIEIPDAKVLQMKDRSTTVPIEDIGIVIIDHSQITITQYLIHKLLENNIALITCNEQHLPTGLLLNLDGNTRQQERFEAQILASVPLKKQMWAQTISMKIKNQAAVLKKRGIRYENMLHWANSVKSGDPDNYEARAAANYWGLFLGEDDYFLRDPDGSPPNNLLNYGYAILRATVARSLVASGLLPTMGIHHHNRYNAYCLADDIMEPYRPYVDLMVLKIFDKDPELQVITKETKAELLLLPGIDVMINNQSSPLMIATQLTAASVAKCFLGETRKIIYPELE